MSELACCAHMNVVYKRIDHPGGTSSDRWECRDCHAEFRRTIWETLRDRFAMAALPGLLRNSPETIYDDIAAWAYDLADAMMRAREGK